MLTHSSHLVPWKRPFEYIAFWQFLGFVFLLCLVWVNELLDLAHLIYGTHSDGIDWIGTCILTACVILSGFVVISHTFVQEKRLLQGMFTICSYCKKVQINQEQWQRFDSFIADTTLAEFSHGICPECYADIIVQKGAIQPTVPGDTIVAEESHDL